MYYQQVKAVLAKQTACVISTSVHAYSSTLKSDILSGAEGKLLIHISCLFLYVHGETSYNLVRSNIRIRNQERQH